MRQTEDRRGRSYWDVFPDLPGQVNISRTQPGQARGFHLHHHKTDYWFCLAGSIEVILGHPDADLGGTCWDWERLKLEEGDWLEIKPGIWHAYKVLDHQPAEIVYYETAKSGTDRSDDQEMPLDSYQDWSA